jgi:hypothetical protein
MNRSGPILRGTTRFSKEADLGLTVVELEEEENEILQDLVLTIHHCYIHTLTNTLAFKITENHLGKAIVRQQQMAIMQAPMPIGAGSPT